MKLLIEPYVYGDEYENIELHYRNTPVDNHHDFLKSVTGKGNVGVLIVQRETYYEVSSDHWKNIWPYTVPRDDTVFDVFQEFKKVLEAELRSE